MLDDLMLSEKKLLLGHIDFRLTSHAYVGFVRFSTSLNGLFQLMKM